MIRSARFKYCIYDSGTLRESLVDMTDDSGELVNLAVKQQYRDTLLEHRRYLSQWIEASKDTQAQAVAFPIPK